ncbi:MAG: hypothetical protein MRJ96_00860 [Nitrospirales bacterium]|nr:hypothetical protein [Nitrospira sp.]MDR4499991.1 hypothetical protein [Nitrospirales bacterium]
MKDYTERRMTAFLTSFASAILFAMFVFLPAGMAQQPEGFDLRTFDPSTLPGEHPPFVKGRQFISLEEQRFPEAAIQAMRKDVEQMKAHGFIEARESQVLTLDLRQKNVKAHRVMADVVQALKITPANVNASKLGQAQMIDIRESGTRVNDKWTGINRLFVVKKMGLVALNEYDFSLAGGGVAVAAELCNEQVNGHPAALRVKESPSKRGMSELTWVTENKVFTLSVNRALKNQKAVNDFIQLAESIQ